MMALVVGLAGCPKKNKPPPVRALYMGEHVTCAHLDAGPLRCQGQLGPLGLPAADGAVNGPREVPYQGELLNVTFTPSAMCLVLAGAPAVCHGAASVLPERPPEPLCVLVGGKITCNSKYFAEVPSVEGLHDVVELAAGRAHVCARLGTKTVSCFGDNTSAQLATPSPAFSRAPVAVQGIFGAEQIVAAGDGTCARLTDKTVRCWGKNDDGRLSVGRGDILNVPAPVHF